MKKYILLFLTLIAFTTYSQTNNNGKLDMISEFSSITTVPFTMPDGIKLQTDIYLPIISDSVTTDINGYTVEIIPKGTQLFVYDSINNTVNINQYKLPLVFTRTPYGKGSYDQYGVYFNILGYAYAFQDMRGRYSSEGVYLPMYSDSWNKNKYHPNDTHPLDVTASTDSLNGNFHQDGKYSISFITDSLYRYYDLDGDGISETYDKTYNGSIAMFGASALGNTQYQAASSIKNNTSQNGLKGLLPIVATNEYFNGVIQHNGVFRQALVQGWVSGQLMHNINTVSTDSSVQNSVHSVFDYGNLNSDTILKRAVDFITVMQDANGFASMYPNNLLRLNGDASFAPIDSLGESSINGQYSRYSNLELPIYHLTGWWDIFIDGQINTFNNIIANTSEDTKKNQKLVIGPWTHGTIAQDTVADMIYPQSVFDLKLVNSITPSNAISDLVDGELVDWFRYLLNYNSDNYIGEPKVMIPESSKWQDVGNGMTVRVPSENYYISYTDFINFLGGFTGLDSMPIQLDQGGGNISDLTVNLPADTASQQAGTQPVGSPVSPPVDFEQIPNIRFYVPGPVNDGEAKNANVGNYWTSAETFPVSTGVNDYTLFFHSNGELDTIAPQTTETTLTYIHDPDNPVETVGGGNLVIQTPQSNRPNSGPMNYASSEFASITMNRADVLKFESDFIQDSMSIIGIPKARIFVSSLPQNGQSGFTDSDFFVRVLDVYPDGREYFVVEGAINARARDYAKQLANGIEDINIPYTNINTGQVYELEFSLLPIAYTFGHNHKIKVLISSSNYPRYQVNANIPIEDGEFFRRSPNDGQSYVYNSVSYSPRISQQGIYFSASQPTQITFPVFDGLTSITENTIEENNFFVYPNPAKDNITVLTNYTGNYTICIYTLTGQLLQEFKNNTQKQTIDIANLKTGIYIIKINGESGVISTRKLVKVM